MKAGSSCHAKQWNLGREAEPERRRSNFAVSSIFKIDTIILFSRTTSQLYTVLLCFSSVDNEFLLGRHFVRHGKIISSKTGP